MEYICDWEITEKNKLCGKKFTKLGLLNRHKKSAHIKPVKCKDCDKLFGTNQDYKKHRENNHVPLPPSDNKDEDGKFLCNFCDFLRALGLSQHLLSKHNVVYEKKKKIKKVIPVEMPPLTRQMLFSKPVYALDYESTDDGKFKCKKCGKVIADRLFVQCHVGGGCNRKLK